MRAKHIVYAIEHIGHKELLSTTHTIAPILNSRFHELHFSHLGFDSVDAIVSFSLHSQQTCSIPSMSTV